MRSFFFTAAIFVALPAFAEEFNTSFVVIGIEQYPYVPDLPVLPGAEADCHAFESALRENGVSPSRIVALCGPEAGRDRIFAKTDALYQEMRAGDRLVYVWTGHGIRDDTGAYFLPASAGNPGLGGADDRIHPDVLLLNIRRFAPAGTVTFFLVDAGHDGEWKFQSLEGPESPDFTNVADVFATSATNVPNTPNLTAAAIGCFTRDRAGNDNVLTYDELNACLAEQLKWLQTSPNIGAGAEPVWIVPKRSGTSAKSSIGPMLLGSGATLAAIGLTSGIGTFVIGSSLKQDLTVDPESTFASLEEYEAARTRYNTMRTLHNVSLGVMGVGVMLGATSFVVTPNAISVSGQF